MIKAGNILANEPKIGRSSPKDGEASIIEKLPLCSKQSMLRYFEQ
jgi:hypothetical protein